MNVVFDERLKDYMARKGYPYVVVDAITPVGCCADVTELVVRFADAAEGERIKSGPCRVIGDDTCAALVVARGLHYDDDIAFGLSSFLGVKHVKVRGISAFKI